MYLNIPGRIKIDDPGDFVWLGMLCVDAFWFTCNAPFRAVHAALGIEDVHVAEVHAGWICL